MKLSIKDVGKVQDASIDLEGITLIAGENNTGKSTLGKALFSIFRSCERISEAVVNERIQHIFKLLNTELAVYGSSINTWMLNSYKNKEVVYDLITKKCNAHDFIKKMTEVNLFKIDSEQEASIEEKIDKANEYSNDDIAIRLINDCFNKEFSDNINNINTGKDSVITISIKNNEYSFVFKGNKLQYTNYPELSKHVVYIDDPLALDTLGESNPFFNIGNNKVVDHRSALAQDVYSDVNKDTIENMVIDDLMEELNGIVSGNITVNKRNFFSNTLEYKLDNKHSLALPSVSAGLKNFILLKHLISLGKIETNGVLILDEPEIHLHPKLQVELAQIVVKLYDKFGLHILVTSHSHYFIDALQTYSKYYKKDSKLKLYLARGEDIATIEDVTDESEKIYETLYEPLKGIERIDFNNG